MPITGGNKVKNAFYKYMADVKENAIQSAISVLDYVGLECVKEARIAGKYTDRTGNLRSSTGYAVVYNGRIIRQSNFEKVHGQGENSQLVDFVVKKGKNKGKRVHYWVKGASGDGSEGSRTGKELLYQLVSQYNNGLVLILVAGMDYAVHVEARGYNVLNSAEDLARRLVPEMLREAGLRK